MKVTWEIFEGIRPRLRPHLLSPQAAQIASNCKLWSGAVEPFKEGLQITSVGSTLTTDALALYRHGQSRTDENYWCTWLDDTDVARGPNADDTQERLYFTSNNGVSLPSVTTLALVAGAAVVRPGAEFFQLGVPPGGAITASSTPGTGTPTAIVVAYLFVSDWGETGALSASTNIIDFYEGEDLAVNMALPPGGRNVGAQRIYIGVADANGNTAFRFWREEDPPTTGITEPLDLTTLGEAAPSPSLEEPPTDLTALVTHPGGFLCGFSGRKFCRSEAYKPYGWPALYRDPLPDVPVGAAVLGSSVVVCTKGKTLLFTGSDPLNMLKTELEGWQPCVAKRSIQRVTAGVVYASADGLVLVSGGGPVQVVTADHFTREQWQAYKPEMSHAAVHDDRYFWWWDNATTQGLLIFELGAGGVQQVVESTVYAKAAYADHRKDELYYLTHSPTYLWKWDAGAAALTATWRSKLFYLDRPQNIGAARVEAAGYPVTFKLYANGALVQTKTVADDRPFTLKGQNRYKDFWIEVSGTQRIDTVSVASSILDLRRG